MLNWVEYEKYFITSGRSDLSLQLYPFPITVIFGKLVINTMNNAD